MMISPGLRTVSAIALGVLGACAILNTVIFLETANSAKKASPMHKALNANLLKMGNIKQEKLSSDIEKRQRKLKKHLSGYCRVNNHKQGLPSLYRFQVIESPQIVSCLVPKVASRQWRDVFKQLRLSKEQLRANLDQYNAKDICKYLTKSYKFMFVREPFERLLSAYKDKFVFTRPVDRHFLEIYGRKIIRNFRPNATQQALRTGHDVTFPEFIEYILKQGVHDGLNWHWNTYEDQCRPCSVNYDFIGRFEYLPHNANYLLKRAGVQNLIKFPSQKNYSRTRDELLKYYSQIPLEWIVQLNRVYHSNFEMFGYPFPGPLQVLFKNVTAQTGRTGQAELDVITGQTSLTG